MLRLLGLKINQTSSSSWLALLRKSPQGPYPNHSIYSRNFSWKLFSKVQLLQGSKKEHAKIGYSYLKSYLHRFNHSANDKCKCSRRETPEHLLLSYPELKSARDKVKSEIKGIKLSLPTLLHTKIGIETTLGFLKETRIATGNGPHHRLCRSTRCCLLPDSRPDKVLDPAPFDPVTHDEGYSFCRHLVAVDALWAGDCLAGSEAETEMLLSLSCTLMVEETMTLLLNLPLPIVGGTCSLLVHFIYIQLEQRRILLAR